MMVAPDQFQGIMGLHGPVKRLIRFRHLLEVRGGILLDSQGCGAQLQNAQCLKHGFHVVDNYPPNFELLVTKFDPNTPNPTFKTDINEQLMDYRDGLTIIRADQCPYTVKNVREIIESAQTLYGLKPRIINLSSAKEAQNSPCAFGTFCIIYNGEILTHHPISNTRFKNIMNKVTT